MVRFKKRYFVVQFDREKDLYDPLCKKKSFKPRALQDSRPLEINPEFLHRWTLDIKDYDLALAVKDLVEHIHGDFGRAAITTGLRAIYSNPETHLALIQCRHGPHRLVASSLPFLTSIGNEKLIPKLVYTGATIKNCFKRMELYQKKQLEVAFHELKDISNEEKKELEERMMSIRSMKN